MGGTRAFSDQDLVATYPRIRAFAYKLCRNTQEAEELTQDTVVKMLSNAARFQPGTSLVSWAHTIAINHFRTRYRLTRGTWKRPSDGATVINALPRMYYSGRPVSPAYNWEPEYRLDLERTVEAIGELNGSGEALLRMALGDSLEQIAIDQKTTPGAVKKRVFRARNELDETFRITRTERRSGLRTRKALS